MKKGFSMVELFVVIAVSGLIIAGIISMFKSSFNIWRSSLNNIDIQQKGRTAIEDMTRFIRQSSMPVSGITPAIGGTATEISFKYIQDTGTIKNMKYYLGSGNLYRVMDGSTSTLVKGNVASIYFNHISSYVVKIESFTLTKGTGRNQKTLTFERTINIRNQ